MNNISGSDYKIEIRIALTTLVASLGLIKIVDLEQLVTSFQSLLAESISKREGIKPLQLLLTTSSMFSYIIYCCCLVFAIYALFKRNENIIKALMIAVLAFFSGYFLMLMLMLNKAMTTTPSPP